MQQATRLLPTAPPRKSTQITSHANPPRKKPSAIRMIFLSFVKFLAHMAPAAAPAAAVRRNRLPPNQTQMTPHCSYLVIGSPYIYVYVASCRRHQECGKGKEPPEKGVCVCVCECACDRIKGKENIDAEKGTGGGLCWVGRGVASTSRNAGDGVDCSGCYRTSTKRALREGRSVGR